MYLVLLFDAACCPTQVEHGGLPGVFLQPIEKPMEQVLRDYHELLCGPVCHTLLFLNA